VMQVQMPKFAKISLDFICTGWPKKFGTIFLYTLTLPNITDFQNYFTVKIGRKFATHFSCVTTLPCDMSSVLKQQ